MSQPPSSPLADHPSPLLNVNGAYRSPLADAQPVSLFQNDHEQRHFEQALERFIDEHYRKGIDCHLSDVLDAFLLHHQTGQHHARFEQAIHRLKTNTNLLHSVIRSRELRDKLKRQANASEYHAEDEDTLQVESKEPYPSAALCRVYFMPGCKAQGHQEKSPVAVRA